MILAFVYVISNLIMRVLIQGEGQVIKDRLIAVKG